MLLLSFLSFFHLIWITFAKLTSLAFNSAQDVNLCRQSFSSSSHSATLLPSKNMEVDLNRIPETTENLDSQNLQVCNTFVGMEFTTTEQSFLFFKQYARDNGFGVRKRRTRTDKDGVENYVLYVCKREGKKADDNRSENSKKRPDVRCGCGVLMEIRLIERIGIYKVTSFHGKHNHPLEGIYTSHLIDSHRFINPIQGRVIENAESAGLGPKKTFRYLSLQAGGSQNVGFVAEDIISYLRKKTSKNRRSGEGGVIVNYFSEKSAACPSFFHDMQIDCEDQIVNFFWADSKMIADYLAFGDVISFDTTFGTNKESRPLGIFSGFNNHRETVIFGVTLLYDETTPSFEWVFETFLRCHNYKKPGVIFTDQDIAMRGALESKMSDVRHCLCSWHILQNAMKNMAGVVNPRMDSFLGDIKSCMFSRCNEGEFERMWTEMVKKYGVSDNDWIVKLYGNKTKWSVAYRMNLFSAGVCSTQLSESVNANIKRDLAGGATMRKFFQGFDTFLQSTREKEIKNDFSSRQSFPHLPVENAPLLKHAAQIYTPKAFVHFKKQWDEAHNIYLDENNPIQGCHVRVAFHGQAKFQIQFDPESLTISCACCRFVTHGFLCAHILRVFDICRVHEIPEKYIMKRFTRYARSGFSLTAHPSLKLTNTQTIDLLSSEFNTLLYRAILDPIYIERIRTFINGEHEFYDKSDVSVRKGQTLQVGSLVSRVLGLKKNEKPKGGRKRRFLSFLENNKRRAITRKDKRVPTTKENMEQSNGEASGHAKEILDEQLVHLTLSTQQYVDCSPQKASVIK